MAKRKKRPPKKPLGNPLVALKASETAFEVMKPVLIVTGSALAVFLVFKLFSDKIAEIVADIASDKIDDEGSAAYVASEFEGSFSYFDTDEDRIFKALEQVPTKAFYKVVEKQYKKLYGEDLNQTFNSNRGLDTDEWHKFLDKLHAKP